MMRELCLSMMDYIMMPWRYASYSILIIMNCCACQIFEISDFYAFGLGFISSLPQFIWD
jgi:hypothetical protein